VISLYLIMTFGFTIVQGEVAKHVQFGGLFPFEPW